MTVLLGVWRLFFWVVLTLYDDNCGYDDYFFGVVLTLYDNNWGYDNYFFLSSSGVIIFNLTLFSHGSGQIQPMTCLNVNVNYLFDLNVNFIALDFLYKSQ